MKFKGTVWLVTAFFGIVLYYYLVDLPAEKKQQEEKERSEKILLFEMDQVEEFTIAKMGHTLRLKRKDPAGWELLEPVKAEADQHAASSFLSTLLNARFSRVVDGSPKDLSLYGLKDPSLKIDLKLKNQEKKTLLAGDDNPINNTLYVKRGEEEQVLLSSTDRKELDKSVFDLRNKVVLDFASDAITKITLRHEGQSFDLIKSGDDWEIADGGTTKADANEVMRFLSLVKSSKVMEFVDENPESLKIYGLETPAIRLTLEAGKENKPLMLLVGDKKENKGFYGKTGPARNIILLGRGLVDTLAKKPVDFMDKVLLQFKEEQVASMQLRTKEEDIQVIRGKEDAAKWQITRPVPAAADTATVNSILFDLKDARVKEFVQSSIQDAAIYGLATPEKTLTLQMGETSPPWTLELGNLSSDGQYYFARRAGDATVFTIAADTINKLFRSLHDLKDKQLLSFKAEEIERVLIEYPGTTFELRKKDEDWSLAQPEKIGKIKGPLGNDILWTLSHLQYESVASASLAPQDTGLDQPVLAITLWSRKNRKTGKITVGKKVADKEEYFARLEDDPALYTIKSRFLDEIPKDVERFKT